MYRRTDARMRDGALPAPERGRLGCLAVVAGTGSATPRLPGNLASEADCARRGTHRRDEWPEGVWCRSLKWSGAFDSFPIRDHSYRNEPLPGVVASAPPELLLALVGQSPSERRGTAWTAVVQPFC